MDILDWLRLVGHTIDGTARLFLEYVKVLAWPAVVFTLALVYRGPLIGVLRRLRKATGWGAEVELENEASDLAERAEMLPELEKQEPAVTQDSVQPTSSPNGSNALQTNSQPERAEPAANQGYGPSSHKVPSAATNPAEYTAHIRALRKVLADQFGEDDKRSSFDIYNAGRMLEAWLRVEKRAAEVGRILGLTRASAANLRSLVPRLVDRGLMSKATALVAFDLQNLRNRLVHELDDIRISEALASDFVESADNLNEVLDGIAKKLKSFPDPDGDMR